MFYWIHDIPTWQIAALFSILFAASTWLGIISVSPILKIWFHSHPGINDLVDCSFGVFYGLLPGLLAVAIYQNASSVEDTVQRERMVTSFWTAKGILDFLTKVAGQGKVMICASGPITEIALGKDSPHGGEFIAENQVVLARTTGIQYFARLPSVLPWRRMASGENLLRVFRGEGRMLVCTTPFWRYKIMQDRAHQKIEELLV